MGRTHGGRADVRTLPTGDLFLTSSLDSKGPVILLSVVFRGLH